MPSPKPLISPNTPRLLELFCGAGGFTWGWTRAGYIPVAAIDNDVAALRTHELNFGAHNTLILKRDLASFEPSELQNLLGRKATLVDVLAGGPPCQGWSKVGRGKLRSLRGIATSLLEDPRNHLYRRFLDYVAALKPTVCVMENVPGMLSVEGINVAQAIVRNFRDIGYECTYAVVNASWFGVPQDRDRLIFIGVREGAGLGLRASALHRFAAQFRREQTRLPSAVTVRQAIGDLPPLGNGAEEDPLPYAGRAGRSSAYALLMRDGSNALVTDHIGRTHNTQDIEAFGTMHEGMTYVELDERFKRYRDDIFTDRYRRLHWNRRSWTITAHLAKDGYSHIHPSQPRTLSIREAARLQSFPDNFRFFGNMGDRFRQIGNAVPPLMAWGIAEYVKSHTHANP
jgi:DNA (cytosine-5)-methyltransferase 1